MMVSARNWSFLPSDYNDEWVRNRHAQRYRQEYRDHLGSQPKADPPLAENLWSTASDFFKLPLY